MNKSNEFVKNTIILMLGKFCTQFISFLLLPLYTHNLDVGDYGYIELLQTYISLLVPVLTLRLDSAVFRFLIDERNSEKGKKNIISNVIITLIILVLFTISAFAIITNFISMKYKILMLLNVLSIMISGIILQITRGIGKTKDYSIASIISGISNLIINVVLIINFHMGAGSILISTGLANIACSIYLILKNKLYKYVDYREYNKKNQQKLLKYSLPMIPNALSWWIVGVSDRTIIKIFLSDSHNGIYSVACKFSNILNSIFSVFNMSWQETASIHINDDDREKFFSNMISKLWIMFISISNIIIVVIPLFFNILIGENYKDAFVYVPILMVGNIFNILIQLIGGIYVGLKKTKEIASTTIISAIINLIINIALINYIELYAASLSTLVAYFAMAIYRLIDIQKYIKIKLDKMKIYSSFTILGISIILYYTNLNLINILNVVFVICMSIIMNREILINYYIKLKVKLFKRSLNENN